MSEADTPMDDGDVPQRGTRLFQVYETDLAELERMLPELCEAAVDVPNCPPRYRVMFRNIQRIVTNIRWNYGPHTDVEIIPSE